MKESTSPAGWILFDNSCGFCRKWVPFWEPVLKKHGFLTVPLQDPWAQEKSGATMEELMREMYLVLADGSVRIGPDAYREAMKRIWWAWPLYALSLVPGLRRLFDAAYRTFARNRYRVSHICRLDQT